MRLNDKEYIQMDSYENRTRREIGYNERELKDINIDKEILLLQIKKKSNNQKNIIYENQKRCAKLICKEFKKKKIINALVYGKTQTGKTGCMTALIKYFVSKNNIPIDNIYIITGLSDVAWKKDTKDRMPTSINDRVYHRANLPKTFVKDVRSKENLLIIMDEIQYACKEEQTLNKIFKECGFYDLDNLLDNDIKLVQFSATPDGNINDIGDWKDFSCKLKLEPGENYVGSKDLLNFDRVKQFKDLTIIENVIELLQLIKIFKNPMYHLIRVPSKAGSKQQTVIENFKSIFKDKYIYNTDCLKKNKEDINILLNKKPEKHTFIFYCEILRCAKTQYKEHIGISYERIASFINDSTITQGSVGRLTGYDDNGESICFTNIKTLENYEKLWESNMEFTDGLSWNSNTTGFNDYENITINEINTFNSVMNIEQLSENCSKRVKENRGDVTIKCFPGEKGEKRGMKWFEKHLKNEKEQFSKKTGPNKTKRNDSGFYIRPLGASSNKDRHKVLSTDRLLEHRRWNLDGKSQNNRTLYTWWPCYSDVNDASTLQWWLIYYDN